MTSTAVPKISQLDDLPFDIPELKIKYLAERDKRLAARPEGNEQYQQFKGMFAHYLTDPYIPRVERGPIDTEIDFLVLGAGFGGLCLAARLMEAGITNMRIMDKAGDFGGTWYWNRYPGAACDVESYIYMPLLEETGYIPTEKYAKAPELLEHSRRIGRHYGLYDNAVFHTEANVITWNEESKRWIVKTDRGDTFRTRFFATASGPLNMPKLPGVKGVEKFKGHSFHTSRWDYDYTGGSLHGNLDKIGDKKIGIIGTGATAIQAIPHLGKGAGKLYVFQRTPSSVARRDNRPTDADWAASLKPGWQEHRQENFLRVMGGAQDEEDLVGDGWTSFTRWMKNVGIKGIDRKAIYTEYPNLLEIADYQNMERIRARCDEVVRDKETAEGLKPWYRQFCKRPCFHDEYLDTYNNPNVHLVHTDGKGIDEITETGIIANGKHHDLDCIIYSTGFEVGTSYTRRSNFKITGRNNTTLDDHWSDRNRTFHGFHMHNFPNLFMISTLHSGYAANFVHMLSRQGKHIAALVKQCKEEGIVEVEATEEAEREWTDRIIKGQWRSAKYQQECTPGYYNLEGQKNDSERAKSKGNYGEGAIAFCKLMDEWREKGDLAGLKVVRDGRG
ncbi:cyclohexanone monooxygenase [Tothia fuscella]|uniref:Cyclohexanone monooxygenase n=1 Tax=Tothia fuscella TaxID=1048955 RepID=A0A9P4TYF2_9PEZI|nr:cyclohexanone monooxygenase [Tothia fuscella]